MLDMHARRHNSRAAQDHRRPRSEGPGAAQPRCGRLTAAPVGTRRCARPAHAGRSTSAAEGTSICGGQHACLDGQGRANRRLSDVDNRHARTRLCTDCIALTSVLSLGLLMAPQHSGPQSVRHTCSHRCQRIGTATDRSASSGEVKEVGAHSTPSPAASAGKSPAVAVDTRVHTIVGENLLWRHGGPGPVMEASRGL